MLKLKNITKVYNSGNEKLKALDKLCLENQNLFLY